MINKLASSASIDAKTKEILDQGRGRVNTERPCPVFAFFSIAFDKSLRERYIPAYH